mgnify:FL=1
MINDITKWASGIIIAVIIATIIEMILPEGSSKKYIKVVIGVYILFTIISPVVSKFTGKSIAVSDIIDLNQYISDFKEKEKIQNSLQEDSSANIRDIYIGNLKSDIQNKLKIKGYNTTKIELDVGYDDNYTLNKISLTVAKIKEKENSENKEENNINSTVISSVNDININVSNQNINNNVQDNASSNNTKSNLSSSDKKKIKEYLSEVYEINERSILINE